MSKLLSRARTVLVVFGALGIGACASPSGPSAMPLGKPAPGEQLGLSSARDVSSGLQTAALAPGVTDATLKKAGWNCLDFTAVLTLCAPPGLGLPPMPPAADGQPSYMVTAFVNHRFDHHVKLLHHDTYNDQPCLGGESWPFLDFLNYYECVIPVR